MWAAAWMRRKVGLKRNLVFSVLTCWLCGFSVLTEVLTQRFIQQSFQSDWPPPHVLFRWHITLISFSCWVLAQEASRHFNMLLPWWMIKAIFCILTQTVVSHLSLHFFFFFTSLGFLQIAVATQTCRLRRTLWRLLSSGLGRTLSW